MAKQKRKKGRTLIGRSDIPYAKRLAIQHQSDVVGNRDEAAKISMYCLSIAMHELEGIGYKRLVRYSFHFKDVVNEFYEDPEVGMAHAKRRLAQMGWPITGEFYRVKVDGASWRDQNIHDNRRQASQIALICGAVAMNDEFGFAKERLNRIFARASELSSRYAVENEQFLLDEMEKLGFTIVNGEAIAYMGEDGNIITPKQWKERKEV